MIDAPGLKKKKNKDGSVREYWMARADIVSRGFRPSSVRLHYPDTDEGRNQLAARCHILQAEMLAWSSRGGQASPAFDGTLKSLSKLFQTDVDSPYLGMKWNSRKNVTQSLVIIEKTVGDRNIGKLLGTDFKRWHREWGSPIDAESPARPWRAKHTMDVTRQLVSYGVTLGYEDCFRADTILGKIRFKTPPARTSIMTADHVEAIRIVAHATGWPSVALATVLQFSLAFRQKDVIGEWEPVEHAEGGITHKGTRWANGLVWSDIDENWILRKKHIKTGIPVEHDLALHPALMEELEKTPADKRIGPVIVSDKTGEPYKFRNFTQRWRKLANTAGVPSTVWNMDARAGAITEAYSYGATETDVMKTAGHLNRQTSSRYNRSTIEQTSRVATMRQVKRTGNND